MNRRFPGFALGALGTAFLVMTSLEPRPAPAPVDEAAVDRYFARLSLAGRPGTDATGGRADPLREEVSRQAARLDRAEPMLTSALTSLP